MTPRWSAPRALLFDLDGTLVHSLPDLADAVDAMLASYQLPALGEAHISSMVGNGSRKLIERALSASSWCGAPGHSDELLADAHHRFLQHYRQHVCVRSSLCPGVAEQLPVLQQAGIKLAVVTNKPIEFVPPLLKALAIADVFSLLIGGDSLPEKKPSALPLQQACAQLGVPVADSIMVGDSRTDIEAARAAGMRVVAVSFGYNHGEPVAASRPDAIIDNLNELPALWR
ncbi:phosphoglycolate phosphatase [Permianibacter sp. IMCC34836]|nr:phosphoglycolate phosphatase [Permianibacter fluminis]